MILGLVHDSRNLNHVTSLNASRHLLRTWANNKFRMEDEARQEHVKLSTEYGLSRLNLGHLVNQTKNRTPCLTLSTTSYAIRHWPPTENNMQDITAVLGGMRTRCVGRYLIDLPERFELDEDSQGYLYIGLGFDHDDLKLRPGSVT